MSSVSEYSQVNIVTGPGSRFSCWAVFIVWKLFSVYIQIHLINICIYYNNTCTIIILCHDHNNSTIWKQLSSSLKSYLQAKCFLFSQPSFCSCPLYRSALVASFSLRLSWWLLTDNLNKVLKSWHSMLMCLSNDRYYCQSPLGFSTSETAF